ncbi:MAG: hypothetical protein HY320_09700 [Armatimonadetes bacterium]|nr:hypothetical protein [Armatimonadota bacterium]
MKPIIPLLGVVCATVASQGDREIAMQTAMQQELPRLKDIYRATTLKSLGPETRGSRPYYRLLTRYVRYVQKNLHDWPNDRGAKFHKVDRSDEMAVRQNATVALGFAVLSAFGDFDAREAGVPREQVRADTAALLRYLSVTHVANFLPTGDGKQWGDAWQSAFWAGIAGQAAWLVWEQLDDETRVMVARMVIHEANRFNMRPPDDGEWEDTKAEENAWNSEVIALARCMFQAHPNAMLWHERAIIYMINSFSTKADRDDETLVDGKRVKDWITTTCIHPDHTLENHARVHPDYLGTFTLNLRNALLYELAGLEAPRAMFHHAADCFGVFQHLTAMNGSCFYVNGQDWWPHRHDVPLMVGGLAGPLLRDRNAARMERGALGWLQKMHSRFDDGRAYDRQEYNYDNAEEELIARYAELYLAHRLFGDPPAAEPREALKAQCGTRVFDIGGFVTHRTPKKFASFAWVNGAMGLVYPSDDTWFTAPYERGLVGRIVVEGAEDAPPKLEARNVIPLRQLGKRAEGGFAFVGRFARCEGKVAQLLAMISLPDAPVVYVERLRAREDVNVKEVATGIVAILNEDAKPLVRNERRVWTVTGETVMRGAADEPAKRHVWETTWANVDDRMGLIAQASGKMAYLENHTYRHGRLQQDLATNYLPNAGIKKGGEVISNAVVGLVPNASHTQPLSMQVEDLGGNGVGVRFRGWVIVINFGSSQVRGKAFGREFTLAPLAVEVQRARQS